MKTFLAILLTVLLGIGVGVGVALLRINHPAWDPKYDGIEETSLQMPDTRDVATCFCDQG